MDFDGDFFSCGSSASGDACFRNDSQEVEVTVRDVRSLADSEGCIDVDVYEVWLADAIAKLVGIGWSADEAETDLLDEFGLFDCSEGCERPFKLAVRENAKPPN